MAAVQLWAVNVAKLSLYLKLNKMKRNLVFMAWTEDVHGEQFKAALKAPVCPGFINQMMLL
jgi:hypothetical protein